MSMERMPPDERLTPQSEKNIVGVWPTTKNLLKSTRGKIGALLASAPLWKLAYESIDAWGNAQTVRDNFHTIIGFFGTTFGSIVLMTLGFVLMAWQIGRQNRRAVSPSQTQRQTTPAVIEESCPDEWLHSLVKSDISKMTELVFLTSCEIKNFNLEADNLPFIEFDFHVFNASIFTVTIQDTIKGNVTYREYALLGEKSIMENKAFNLRHGKGEVFKIRQRLDRDECAKMVARGKMNPTQEYYTHVDLSNLEVRFQVEYDGVKFEPLRLKLPPKVRLPLNELIEQQQESLKVEQAKLVQELTDRIKDLESERSTLEIATVKAAKAIEQHKTTIEQLSKEISTLSVRISFRDNERESYDWLYKIAGTQKDEIDQHVQLEKCTLGDLHLDHPVPSVRFGIYITNHSVFDITVELDGGYIVFAGQRLNYPINVLYNDLKDAPCGKEGCLTLEQPLRREEADFISASKNKSDANFYFDKLLITIKGGQRCPQVVSKPLIVTKGVHISGGPLTFRTNYVLDEVKDEQPQNVAQPQGITDEVKHSVRTMIHDEIENLLESIRRFTTYELAKLNPIYQSFETLRVMLPNLSRDVWNSQLTQVPAVLTPDEIKRVQSFYKDVEALDTIIKSNEVDRLPALIKDLVAKLLSGGNPLAGNLSDRDKPSSTDLLNQLAEFRDEGNEILKQLVGHKVLKPYEDHFEDWKGRVQTYLNTASPGFAARFRSETIDYSYPKAASGTTRPLFDKLHSRIMRLEEFIRERSR